jgi:HK97 family phage prohead protease
MIEDFKLIMQIDQAFEKSADDGSTLRYIGGRASGTNLDLDGERMAQTAIAAFQKAIKEGITLDDGSVSQIPLRSGHRKEWDDILGWVVDAHVDESNDLWIVAELEDTAKAADLFTKLTTPQKAGRPNQLGFSVGGKIQKASLLWDSELKRSVRTIEDVALKEISVVGRPAYATAYVEALSKSVNWDDVERPSNEPVKEQPMTLAESNVSTESVEETTKEATTAPVVEEVQKDESLADAATEVTTETVVETPDYGTQIATLSDQVNKLTEAVSLLIGQSEESNKSETVEEVTTDVQKSEGNEATETDVAEIVKTAISAAFASFTETVINPINEKLDATKSVIEEIGAQGIDKSLSVVTSKDPANPIDAFIKKYEGASRADLSSTGFIRDIVQLAQPGALNAGN